jgi:hypothetical protein
MWCYYPTMKTHQKWTNNLFLLTAVLLLLSQAGVPAGQASVPPSPYLLPGWGTGGETAGSPAGTTLSTPPLDKKRYLPLAAVGPDNASKYFSLLSPGSALPGDAACAAAVKSRSENKGMNKVYNATKGSHKLPSDFFGGSDPRANGEIGPRVTGNFTGTTDEILQWAACKWGADEDMVRAQAAVESWWQQTAKGDWTSDSSRCAPGHGIGADGRTGQCPESFGILQNRYPYMKGAWPGIHDSTAFNADTALSYWRACYEGYEWWLNQVDRGAQYAAGDAWGCVGRWYAGRWYTAAAVNYTNTVKAYLKDRVWESPGFQEP